jgi:prolyl-tRNA editing enzyme YbaK/EbsC (Cys-tRNA(Pro) deacylase)
MDLIVYKGVYQMSVESVKEYLKKFGADDKVMEFDESSATVELAAQAVGVEPARIAKTLSFKKDDGCILIVTAGDAKIDNTKFKKVFSTKAKMLSQDEVLELVGHPVGGVCPFGIKEGVPVYLDISMKRFGTVFPACGSGKSAIELTCDELFQYSGAREWIDVCKGWE